MSHFSDYMDGVPVKISEKYKRPPRIELPYSVSESPLRAQNVVDNAKYCSTFETNILSKLRELRSAKETKKNERRHRLQLLQEAKQKKLDIIAAAEAEEKLKQLSVSEVSYPSTEEISALSPDEKTDRFCDTTPTQDESDPVETLNQDQSNYPSTSNSVPPNMLQPIQVQSNYHQNNLLDDPDPLWELKMNTKITKIPKYNNMDNITFKDFENDTSSPFDNVELKTINDMELLAQILQGQSPGSSHPQSYVSNPNYAMSNSVSQAHIDGITYMPTTYIDQPVQVPSAYSSPQHYPVSNGYYVPTDNACDNIPIENMNIYIPNYQYYVPTQPYPVDPSYFNNQPVPASAESTYIPQPYYFQCPQMPSYQPENILTHNNSTTSQNTIKSRSRSVPDIVKELNDELASAKLRASERSQNVSPEPKVIPRSSSNSDRKEEKRSRIKSKQLPNPFDKLPSKLQVMCQQIHGMGFPLDRVARVCSLVGQNDKKIIESLLIMGELMDLGFPESRVSAALAKHEFNRDKALDELVS